MAERSISLKPLPLTSERFAPFGDVIEASRGQAAAMNAARFERFDDLCDVDVGGKVSVSIARCRAATVLPLRIETIERHPLGSQAFVPLQSCEMVIVVAPPGESVDVSELRAFVTQPHQGFNYRRGTWHMPLIAFSTGHEFLVIDRGGMETNCEECVLDEIIMLEAV